MDEIRRDTGVVGILPLELRGVSYEAQGRRLVDTLNLRLEPGSLGVMLGPNGAGKTLTLRLCHGLIEPTLGTVNWLGPEGAQARGRQAMVFQRPVLLRRSAQANIRHALALNGVPRSERADRTREALERVGLSPLANRQARVLSGGEQQRLALARAWALRPEVLFLDEPTASLDPAAALAMEQAVRTIHAAGTTILMTTHDLGQARRFAQTVFFMHRGRLIEQGPAADFFAAPRTREARAFLAGDLLT